ncbi:Type IV Pilus-assembly protein W [Geopseudomonas sagittaria]|uniref:Type IV Pilus-assembly protein W n=1 Tax=Geopseudomonas sagittaria TaxID=1135990 RepID=A0A1I5UXK5_9GAMM|nr:PilW family protein [Pseudomonas sagittaria]SFP99950.1 Type IV Pilus-assembly protein W [Pseudomonas sagittaria]
MNKTSIGRFFSLRTQAGFNLVELMVASAIGMLIMVAILTLYLNVSRTNDEMARTNVLVENGRFVIQVLQKDLAHAGFWDGFVPEFDDLTSAADTVTLDEAALGIAVDTGAYPAIPERPTGVPDPCRPYAEWGKTPSSPNDSSAKLVHRSNLLSIPVQVYDAAPASCSLTNQQANTDLLVVRHADTCVDNGEANSNCPEVDGELYFQNSWCVQDSFGGVQGAEPDAINLSALASGVNDIYNGMNVYVMNGVGAGQMRSIVDYEGPTRRAVVSPWETQPALGATYYVPSYVLDTAGLNLKSGSACNEVAPKRRFISNIYYIRDYAVSSGDGIPTLMRSSFGVPSGGGDPQQLPAQPLIEGVEGFRVEVGIDDISKTGTGADVDYSEAVTWTDSDNKTTATNRGDGAPDRFVRCPTEDRAVDNTAPSTEPAATVCTADDLEDAVAVKLYVLVRSREPSRGHVDTKTYTLGSTTLGPFNDGFKRHVFSSTVRLNNVSGRRETP